MLCLRIGTDKAKQYIRLGLSLPQFVTDHTEEGISRIYSLLSNVRYFGCAILGLFANLSSLLIVLRKGCATLDIYTRLVRCGGLTTALHHGFRALRLDSALITPTTLDTVALAAVATIPVTLSIASTLIIPGRA